MNIKLLIILGVGLLLAITANAQSSKERLDNAVLQKGLIGKGFTDYDLSDIRETDHYYSASLGMYHTYYTQYIEGIPVENAVLNVGVKDGKLAYSNERFFQNVSKKNLVSGQLIRANEGLSRALEALGKRNFAFPGIKFSPLSDTGTFIFDKGLFSKRDIAVSLIWIQEDNDIRLCWQSSIELMETNNEWYDVYIDAKTGDFVKKQNNIINCTFDRTSIPTFQKSSEDISKLSSDVSIAAGGYTVFDLPVESPSHGARTITSNPWLRAGAGNNASSLGWHDNGTNAYTITRGNNVYAYEDADANNVAGYSPNGGAMLSFQYPFIPTNTPVSNQDAAITNLFHTSNLVHDITYQYGFDEAAGNFQTNNLGRGGLGNDPVLAEALDGSSTDNANFSIVADGSSGRMQMFLWTDVSPVTLAVNSPNTLPAEFGALESGVSTANKLINVGPITGDVVLANPDTACAALTNAAAVAGKIALIYRGSCAFTDKIKNAQMAGAVAVIVVNSVPNASPFIMGGTDNTITIPAVMVSYEAGAEIKNALLSGAVNITLSSVSGYTPDGSYDNGIIVHEYGHGISTRLTGGPASPGCLSNKEQMGEGWSDFFGLMLTTDWSQAQGLDPRGLGTYVFGEPTDGTGIRTYPYTTNINVNPFTYADVATAPVTAGNPSVHYIGSIWATMLWEMTWKIIAAEGIDADIYHGTGGNNIAMQLVMDGLKLQPCSPGFVDGRDAILLADEIRYGGVHKCLIWEAFAKRGLGVAASQGSSTSHTDGTVSFNVPSGYQLNKSVAVADVYEGQLIDVKVTAICNCVPQSNAKVKENIANNMEVVEILEGSLIGNEMVSNAINLNPFDSTSIHYKARVKLCSASAVVTNQFFDNVEGSNQFTSSRLSGTINKPWTKIGGVVKSPIKSWYFKNEATAVDYVLKLSSALAISGPTKLTFYHRFQTEPTWDGGVVEISIDNGANWVDAGPYFTENGYASQFDALAPLSGRMGFTGKSDSLFSTMTFVKSVIQLGTFSGNNVLIRFRFASDTNTGGGGINGWYIDDISVDKVCGVASDYSALSNNVLVQTQKSVFTSKIYNSNPLYVDESATTGLAYGGTWPNAFTHLKDAFQLAACRSIDTVYIAQGTYSPAENRDSSFVLSDGMHVFGGFPAGGSNLANRDAINNETILSGDIGTPGNTADNVYHVVTNANTSVLDGFILEKGNANGGGEKNKGSAIYNTGSLMLKNVVVRNTEGNSSVENKGSVEVVEEVRIK